MTGRKDRKSEIGSQKSEEENSSDPHAGRPNSEIKNKSEIVNDEAFNEVNPKSKIKNKSEIEHPKRRSPLEHHKKINKSEKSEINMEVHHHPQLEHKPKPWKEYILEGLMIFLAVTMGFFAETLREHISDSNREQEFAKALYAELSADSIAAANNLHLRIEKEKDLDYLYAYFKDSSLTALPRRFYPAFTNGLYMINSHQFEPKDGVMSQLKSSGSERYFKSVALQKLLGDLSVSINNMRYRNEQEYQFFASPLKAFLLKYYDFGWLNQMREKEAPNSLVNQLNAYRQNQGEIKGNILNAASLDRVEAANMMIFYKQMLLSTRTLQLNNYSVANHKILDFLKKTYTLER